MSSRFSRSDIKKAFGDCSACQWFTVVSSTFRQVEGAKCIVFLTQFFVNWVSLISNILQIIHKNLGVESTYPNVRPAQIFPLNPCFVIHSLSTHALFKPVFCPFTLYQSMCFLNPVLSFTLYQRMCSLNPCFVLHSLSTHVFFKPVFCPLLSINACVL